MFQLADNFGAEHPRSKRMVTTVITFFNGPKRTPKTTTLSTRPYDESNDDDKYAALMSLAIESKRLGHTADAIADAEVRLVHLPTFAEDLNACGPASTSDIHRHGGALSAMIIEGFSCPPPI